MIPAPPIEALTTVRRMASLMCPKEWDEVLAYMDGLLTHIAGRSPPQDDHKEAT